MDETTSDDPSPRTWDDEPESPARTSAEEEGPTRTSVWPLVVAMGLTVSEVGVFMGVYPLAVGGLVLFVASVAGITHEAGYTGRPWRLAGALGVVLVAVGVWMVSTQVPLAVDPVVAAVGGPTASCCAASRSSARDWWRRSARPSCPRWATVTSTTGSPPEPAQRRKERL